jgi:hypothetical protein
MERRSLLRQLLSLGVGNLTKLANGNLLTSSDQHEIKAICHILSRLYDRKLTVAKLRRGTDTLARYALSPLSTEAKSNSIQQYEIAKIGRREFLLIGGAIMAVAAGGALYYVSPDLRAITTTVTKRLTEATTVGTAEARTTVETPINTYRMTTSALGYYLPAHMQEGYEMHFKTTRRGKIEDVRNTLESEGMAYFQKEIYNEFGRRIPKKRIRIGFEREEPAKRVQNSLVVEARYMEYRGGKWKSRPVTTEVSRCAKKA